VQWKSKPLGIGNSYGTLQAGAGAKRISGAHQSCGRDMPDVAGHNRLHLFGEIAMRSAVRLAKRELDEAGEEMAMTVMTVDFNSLLAQGIQVSKLIRKTFSSIVIF
jgi:hypothetical protein